MKLANVDGRAVVMINDNRGVDVAGASGGEFGPSMQSVYDDWDRFRSWTGSLDPSGAIPVDRSQLGAPSPTPSQVLAVGLNYSEHAAESGFAEPDTIPPTFTKYVSALSGPDSTVTLPVGGSTDWEVELVVVIGQTGTSIREEDAWDHVAGLTVGQDISERITQRQGPAPQFSLGKSFRGFGPTGPWLTTPDSLADKDDLALGCTIDGETVQDGRTSDLIFSVSSLISTLSHIVTLHPGDLIFTGTPSGVGMGRTPQRFLEDGEHLRSWIEGLGELNQVFVAATEV